MVGAKGFEGFSVLGFNDVECLADQREGFLVAGVGLVEEIEDCENDLLA